MQTRRPKTLQEAVSLTLDGRNSKRWPVSIAATVRATRALLPDCDLTDAELCDLVAIAATERGLSITFDGDLLENDGGLEAAAA